MMNANRRELLYIMSPSYSGSTLLTFLLARHPDIATVGELKATSLGDPATYHCSCGTPLLECEFWRAVSEKLPGGLNFHDFGTHFPVGRDFAGKLISTRVRPPLVERLRSMAISVVPSARGTYARVLERNTQMIDAVCELQDARVFVDGSKDPVRLRHMYESGRWNIKVINLTRDCRGVCRSYMKNNGVDMAEAARHWLSIVEEVRNVKQLLPPETVLDVRYEDLCDDPARMLGAMFDFCGLQPLAQPEAIDLKGQHILGNRMRLGAVSEIKLDEKWRHDLGDVDREYIESCLRQRGLDAHGNAATTALAA